MATYEEAIEHLRKHEEKGDYVPPRAYEGLKEDMKNNEPLDKICDGPMIVDFKKGEAKPLEEWLEEEKTDSWKDEDFPNSDDWKEE